MSLVVPLYSSACIQACTILEPDVVRHIKFCMTKKGMKAYKLGRKRQLTYPKKRSEIIKLPPGQEQQVKIKNPAIFGEIVDRKKIETINIPSKTSIIQPVTKKVNMDKDKTSKMKKRGRRVKI